MVALAKTLLAKDAELSINDQSSLNRSLVKTASQTKKAMRTNDKPTQSTGRLMGLGVKPHQLPIIQVDGNNRSEDR